MAPVSNPPAYLSVPVPVPGVPRLCREISSFIKKRDVLSNYLINNSDYRVLTIPVQMLSQEQWVSHWRGVAALLALPLGSQPCTQPTTLRDQTTRSSEHTDHTLPCIMGHGLSHFTGSTGWWLWSCVPANPRSPSLAGRQQ